MNIQKHFSHRPYLKYINQNPALQYRVRNLSKNHSMKQLITINNSKKDVLNKINNKYTIDTSFFAKENHNSLQIQSQQDLPKYTTDSHKNIQQKPIKRNASHRILRKVNSQQLLPQSSQSIPIQTSLKSSFMKQQTRKFSLKKKVQFIKKKHNEDKSQNIQSQFIQVQSQNFLADKKKSKPKLKLLVRDPFQSSKINNDRRKTQIFSQSRIQPMNDNSMISQSNRQQFEQFLSCLN